MRNTNKRTVIERGSGYKIYELDGLFFLDIYKEISHGFETLAGARESAYYLGYRDTKN